MVNNLYGVDIMEEAVEICKLRLFLKLVAQLDRSEQIEPLPDIDFNVRAGNTLVGFTSLQEIQDAFVTTRDGQRRMLYPEDKATLTRITKNAARVDRAFRQFYAVQTKSGRDAGRRTDAKEALRERFAALRDELDKHLGREYGVAVENQRAYRHWRASHQPFHWFVEFHGLLISAPRMLPLMRLLTSRTSIHMSSFAVRPAKLFVGVDMNFSIVIGTLKTKKDETRFLQRRTTDGMR